MNGYELSKKWFDYCFQHPEKIKPIHTAIYMFAIEQCNRLSWKEKFGFPTKMAMEVLGIHSYNSYIKALNDIVEWGFITMIDRSKNQYTSNIIALSKFDEAQDEALDKALYKAHDKASEKHLRSTDSINKLYKPIKPSKELNLTKEKAYSEEFDELWEAYGRKGSKKLAYEEYKKLSTNDISKAKEHIPKYVQAHKGREVYMKDFERYLKHGTYHSAVYIAEQVLTNVTTEDQLREFYEGLNAGY